MRRVVALAAALILLIPAGSFGQPGGPKEWMAHPPIHPRGPAQNTVPGDGYTPAKIRSIYGFSATGATGAGQIIAIIDAFDDPTIAKDLAQFSSQFRLAAMNTGCTVSRTPHATPCFQKVFAQGGKYKTNSGWALETSLDVEWAHAIAPGADILLVEAQTNSFVNLLGAIAYATSHDATVVSMSWGGGEFSSETSYDTYFNQPGVMFTASSGDSGSGTEWPAASPYVLSVGGTTLNQGISPGSSSNTFWVSETAWSGSGGGISSYEAEPDYQTYYPIPGTSGKRGIPDVAYDADPNTGVDVYDTTSYYGQTGWFVVGGTSVGAPSWAALIALADESRSPGLSTSPSGAAGSPIYNAGGSFYGANYHDIASGSNGTCNICSAGAGYDFVTGLGSPQANNLIPYLHLH